MKILSSIDIAHMIAKTHMKNENSDVCVGKGKSEKVVVKKGTKNKTQTYWSGLYSH